MYSNCNLTLFSLSQTIVTRGLVALSKTNPLAWDIWKPHQSEIADQQQMREKTVDSIIH